MHIVLFEPEIPQNTGNIIRTCSVTGSSLILVHPLGFSFDSKQLKRAGLDYFSEVEVTHVYDFKQWLESVPRKNLLFFSSKVEQKFSEATYYPDSYLIFGSETKGLPSYIAQLYEDRIVTLPMKSGKRCLNLATSVGIGLYHGLYQQNFKPLLQGV